MFELIENALISGSMINQIRWEFNLRNAKDIITIPLQN
jgi:hypothetical protein